MFSHLTQNPIFQFEANHLRLTQPFKRLSWPKKLNLITWPTIGTRWVLVGLSVFAVLFAVFNNVIPIFNSNVLLSSDLIIIPFMIYSLLVIAELIAMVFHTLALGANLIAREHQGGRFEMLVLTGIPARSIIAGKWWAGMRSMQNAVLYAMILRLGLPLVLGWLMGGFTGPVSAGAPPLVGLLMLPGLVFVCTYMATGLLLAIGMMMSAASTRPARATAAAGVFFIGLWIVLVLLGHAAMLRWVFPNYGNMPLTSFVLSTIFSILENGSIVTSWVVFPGWVNTPEMAAQLPYLLLGLGVGLTVYGLMTALFLWVAEDLLVRRGALTQ